jgi:hypothetical protein
LIAQPESYSRFNHHTRSAFVDVSCDQTPDQNPVGALRYLRSARQPGRRFRELWIILEERIWMSQGVVLILLWVDDGIGFEECQSQEI